MTSSPASSLSDESARASVDSATVETSTDDLLSTKARSVPLEFSDHPDFERFDVQPRISETPLRTLISENWLAPTRFGACGEILFRYYNELSEDDSTDFEALNHETQELISAIQSQIHPGEVEPAYRHFLSLHRFYALLTASSAVNYENAVNEFRPYVLSTFEWMVNLFCDYIFPDFLSALTAPSPLTDKITSFRDSLSLRIGSFIWERVVVAVDLALANLHLANKEFTTIRSMSDAGERLNGLCASLNLELPYFRQSLAFLQRYAEVIADSLPFVEVAPDLPPDFLLALVVNAKRKRIIGLELSDLRILEAAEAANADVAHIDRIRLTCKQEPLELPHSLWMSEDELLDSLGPVS
jgi:hypothetical protein